MIQGIEAKQWDGTWEQISELKRFCPNLSERFAIGGSPRSYLYITNQHGDFMVSPRSWVIKDILGDFHIYKKETK